MVAWWVMLLIQIGLTLVYDLIKPKPKIDSPEPAGLSDFKVPTVGDGRVIPIVWGTVLVSGPMVVWYGNLKVVPIEEEVSTGIFTSETITKGYQYYLGMDCVLCSGEIDQALALWSDGECVPFRGAWGQQDEGQVVYTSDPDFDEIDVEAYELYGGDDEEGGLWGDVLVYRGSETQPEDDYLNIKMPGYPHPPQKGICHAVFRLNKNSTSTGFYWGTSPYLKDVGFEIRRCPNGLSLPLGYERIGHDANPACMIYDLLVTSPGRNGLGIPVGQIDVDSFRAVGTTLAEEELGLSMILDKPAAAKDVVLDILRHIDGVIYVEPATGLLTLDLVRFDYVEEELPIFDEDNCTVTSYSRGAWNEIKNEVRVQYTNRREGYQTKTVIAQNQAAIESAGGEVSTVTLSLKGFSHETNASKACSKALAGLSYPLANLSLVCDRSGWDLRPGSAFVLNWPDLGISGMVCRVTTIGKGELISGKIEIEAIEDQFAVDWTAYSPPDGSEWVDPAGAVEMLTDQAATTAPYEAVKLTQTPEGSQQAMVVAARNEDGITKGFNAWVDDDSTRFDWLTPSGELNAAISESSTSIVIDAGPDCDLVQSVNDANFDAGYNVAWLEGGTSPDQASLEEFIAFKTAVYDDVLETLTLSDLARGVLDTAPTSFASGTRIWIASAASGIVNIEDSGSTSIKFQPFNNAGGYDLDLCPSVSVSALTNPRRGLAYCPTAVLFNTASYPSSISGELTVAWSHRNRLGEWGYADSGETSSPEDGTTYTLKFYGESDTLIRTETGITGTSYTYLEADEIADSGLGRLNNSLRVELYTVCSGKYSLRMIDWYMTRT